ncbi:MAG: hypothetical protein RSB39_03465 [Oscillospiraceae bacterium]
MTTSEKVAYLKGLAEGLGLGNETREDKLFAAIIDVLDVIAHDIEDIEENALDLGEEIDAISDDLSVVEGILMDDDDECCCCHDDDDDCCCGGHHDDDDSECCCGGHHEDEHHHHEGECCHGGGGHHDHEGGCCHGHHEPVFFEVTCPACNNTITIDEDVLTLGKITCPSCGETLEFDLDCVDFEDEAPLSAE